MFQKIVLSFIYIYSFFCILNDWTVLSSSNLRSLYCCVKQWDMNNLLLNTPPCIQYQSFTRRMFASISDFRFAMDDWVPGNLFVKLDTYPRACHVYLSFIAMIWDNFLRYSWHLKRPSPHEEKFTLYMDSSLIDAPSTSESQQTSYVNPVLV